MLTGKYPSQVGLYGNLSSPCPPLDEGIGTIADRLQAAGYQTVYCGKSHVGGDLRKLGFEIAYDNGHDESTLTEACRYWRNRDWVVNKRPFFQVVSFLNPHDVYFVDPDGACEPELPPWPSAADDLSAKPWPQQFSRGGGGWTPPRWGTTAASTAPRWRRWTPSSRSSWTSSPARLRPDHVGLLHGRPRRHGRRARPAVQGAYMYEGATRVPFVIMPPASASWARRT